MLRTSELDYDLPPECVATRPAEPRDRARLMVVDRKTGGVVADAVVRDLPGFLAPGDVLVVNRTRVLPARVIGRREGTGGGVEALYLGQGAGGAWRMLVKSRRHKEGAVIRVLGREGKASPLELVLLGRDAVDGSVWEVEARWEGVAVETQRAVEVLGRVGHAPLPPYIRAARKRAHEPEEREEDWERYQTVYAQEAGSVAAPTAGLHFTAELMERVRRRGVEVVEVLLHVGAGTFKPVETEHVEEHPMHAEWCAMSDGAVRAVEGARREGRRVIAVGTTSVRVLETYGGIRRGGDAAPEAVETRLLITPGYRFAWVDGLMTNFHLPRSTLMALVGAMLPRGVSGLKELYARAVERGYRFYSYGDAMLLLP